MPHAGKDHGQSGFIGAAMTSSSLIDPPGWMTAVAPADAAKEAVSKGKEGIRCDHRIDDWRLFKPLVPGEIGGLLGGDTAQSRRDIWPAPMQTVASLRA